MFRFRMGMLRARFVAATLLVGLAPVPSSGQSPTTRPRDLVLIVRPSGGQLEFSVSAPGLANVSSARVLRDGRIQPDFQARVVFDSATGAANVSVSTRGRPAAGEYTVQLAAGKQPAMYSLPLTVRMLGESEASGRGSRRPDAPSAPDGVDASDIAVSRPGAIRNPTPNRGVTGTREPEEAPARPTRDGASAPARPTRDGVAAPTRPTRDVEAPGRSRTDSAPELPTLEADPRRRGETPAVIREGIPGAASSVKGPREIAVVSGFSPRNQAISQGTLLLEGTRMTYLPFVYLGETRLEKVYNDATKVAVALPDVDTALTGDLSLDDLTPGGENRVVLASGFRVLPKAELPMEVELVSIDPAVGNLPHALNNYTVRYKNVPGQYLRPGVTVSQTQMITRNPVIGGQVQKEGEWVRFFGGEFTLSFRGKPFIPMSSMNVSMTGGSRPTREQYGSFFSVGGRVTLPDSVEKTEYEVTNTADLDEYFQWQRTWAFGVTEGKSEMPLGRSVDVGRLKIDGDTAFRIASGPLGTHGKWQSAPLLMKEGWYVKRLEWSMVQTKPEGHEPKAYVKIHKGGGDFDRAPDQLLYADTNPVWPVSKTDEPNHNLMMRFEESIKMNDGRTFEDVGKDPFEWYFRPMQVELKADITLLNDHDVTLRLTKVVFSGPPGKQWRDAIKSLILNDKINFLIGDGSESTLRVFQPRD